MQPEILSKTIIMYAIVLYGLYNLLVKKDFGLLNLFVLLLPIKGLMFEVGLQLMSFYIPLFLAFFIELTVNKGVNISFNKKWLIFVSYLIVSTFIISNFFVPYFQPNVHNSYFRTEGRYISYLFKVAFLQAGIFFIVFSLLCDKRRILSLLKTYILSMQVLTVLGGLQFIVYYLTGFNITPIGVNGRGDVRQALSDLVFASLGIPRICSLGGEPKGLAASLCVALLILISARLYKIDLIKNINYWIWAMILVLLLTLSTGGFMLFAIMLVLILLLRIVMNHVRLRLNWKVITFVLAFFIVSVVSYEKIYNIIDVRILQRSERLLNEDIDYAIQAFMFDQPKWTVFGTGSGNVHNFAYPYIEEPWLQRMQKHQIFISRYGYIRFISENGFVGFALFLLFAFSIPFALFIKRKRIDKAGAFILISFIAVVFFLVRSRYVEAEMYFLLAICMAWYRASLKENQTHLSIA